VKAHIIEEPEPRGTCGAVKNVAHMLDDTTFIFNGDVMTDLDLQAMSLPATTVPIRAS
jgi:mannose-1-phosphate guanylyltransferase